MKTRTIFLLTGIISLSLFFVSCGDYKTKKLPDGTLEIVEYNGKETDVVIPTDIKGVTITVIGFYQKKYDTIGAFQGKQLTSIVIPNSVTTIRERSFSNNRLTSVNIPDSVTEIGSYAFSDNQLTSVDIPDSVTEIGSYAFSNNQLTNIVIPDNVTSIGSNAFKSNQLTSVTIGSSVTSIREQAFSDNQLTSVTIPNSVTTIGERAFSDNQLTSVTIPSSVTSIGSGAFRNNQLTEARVPPNLITQLDSSFDSGVSINAQNVNDFLYEVWKSRSDGNYVSITSYKGSAKDVVIPARINGLPVKNITLFAFAGHQLTSVTLPDSLTVIWAHAFQGNQLTSVVIPSGVTRINSMAFYDNPLTSVIFPNSLRRIEQLAFANPKNNKLTSITIGANVNIDPYAFDQDESEFGFRNYYNTSEKRAGKYFTIDGWWSWSN